MSHLEDAFRYISAMAAADNYISNWDKLVFTAQPQEGLIEVLVKLKVVSRGVGGPWNQRLYDTSRGRIKL